MKVQKNKNVIEFEAKNSAKVLFDIESKHVSIDDLQVSFPGEYEKSGILLEVKEYSEILFYSFSVDQKHLLIITEDSFELKEEILSFFGDVDVLLIVGTKKAATVFENIEARIVIPYGEGKEMFLSTLGQTLEEVEKYTVKSELPTDESEFVCLA